MRGQRAKSYDPASKPVWRELELYSLVMYLMALSKYMSLCYTICGRKAMQCFVIDGICHWGHIYTYIRDEEGRYSNDPKRIEWPLFNWFVSHTSFSPFDILQLSLGVFTSG